MALLHRILGFSLGFVLGISLFIAAGFYLYWHQQPIVVAPNPAPVVVNPAPVYNFKPVSYYPVRAPSIDLPYPQIPPVIVLSQKPARVLVVNRVAPAPSQYFYY